MAAAERVWDAIVVGAGPAGCAAAWDLATAGYSVLLLDKKTFPRLKPCAGGLTIKAVRALRYAIDPVIRETVNRVRLDWQEPASSAASAPILLKNREPICVMTVRAEFDAFCVAKTLAAGAVFRTISSIRQIVGAGDRVSLLAGEETLTARFLVGADGANGQVRSLCAPGPWFSQGFALEVHANMPTVRAELTFDFAAIANGYGWVFPKKDHLNVGLYVQSRAGNLKRADLLQYLQQTANTETIGEVVGQYLGIGAADYRSDDLRPDLRKRVFLVGDAGGFVDALTGEGIFGAVLSGQAAATAIHSEFRGRDAADRVFAGCLRDYRQTLSFSSRAAGAFYGNPGRGFRLMRLPLARRILVRTYTHGLNVKSFPMRIALARA